MTCRPACAKMPLLGARDENVVVLRSKIDGVGRDDGAEAASFRVSLSPRWTVGHARMLEVMG
jgi:hypothetical protein